MPELELVNPKIKKAPQTNPREVISRMIAKVEQPEGLEAARTFGRKQTASEIQAEQTKRFLFELAFWLAALVIIAIIVIANWETISGFLDLATGRQDPEPVVIATPTPVPTNVTTSMFSGSAYQLAADLGWVRSELFRDLTYYAAGEVKSGEYTGARRFFAVGLLVSDSTLATYEFWQLPDGQVLLNGEKQNPRRWLTLLNDYYIRMFFAPEVTMIDQLSGDWPVLLELTPSMVLYRRELLTDLGPYDEVTSGSPRLALALPPEYYQPLGLLGAQKYAELKLYSKMYSSNELFDQVTPNLAPTDEWIVDRFLYGGSKVIVTDRTGVSYVYELVFRDAWEKYLATRDNDLRYLEYYQQELIKYTATASFASYRERALAGQVLALPDGQPRMPVINEGLPGLNFVASDFEFTDRQSLFGTYVSAFTPVCYPRIDAKVVQNLTSDDVIQVGRLAESQLPVYTLRDREHVLNQLAYRLKILGATLPWEQVAQAHFDQIIKIDRLSEQETRDVERGDMPLREPTLYEYADARPLLLISDPWDRYLLVWENDIDYLQDCGII